MEFKGTKGSWSSDGDGKHRMCIDVRFGDTGIKTIATIHTNGTIEEVKANALLISKAPEMLDFINRISGEMLRNDFALDEKWYEQAQQLIKSATEI